MDSPYSEGQPSVSNYNNYPYPAAREQSAPMTDFSEAESFSGLPSSLDEQQQPQQQQQQSEISDTSSLSPVVCQSQLRQLSPPIYQTDAGAHMTPHPPHQPRSQHVWPSPPLAPGDIQNCIPFTDSPASGGMHLSCYTHTPNSPADWPSPASNFPPSSGLYHPDSQPYGHRICTPTMVKDFSGNNSDIDSPYSGSFPHDPEMSVSSMERRELSPSMASHLPPPLSTTSMESPDDMYVATPASLVGMKVESLGGEKMEDEVSMETGGSNLETLPSGGDLDANAASKNDEPYAKLIYKAFMSQPNHAMTLQEIYQWFRENTDKTGNEKGGWQNSIRHNLSMNKAFARRDRKQLGEQGSYGSLDGRTHPVMDSKRANEWILQPWAVGQGVLSTTRYRSKTSNNRRSGRCTSHPNGTVGGAQAYPHSSTKAISGRKGGCAARNARLRGRQYSQESSMARTPYRLIERGLDSPPRSTMTHPGHPYLSTGIPVSLSRLTPGTTVQTPMVHSHGHGHGHGHDNSNGFASPAGGDSYSISRLGQGMAASSGLHNVLQAPMTYMGEQPMYMPSSSMGEFPYGVGDVHLGYQVDHRNPDGSDAGRLYEPLHSSVGDWNKYHGM